MNQVWQLQEAKNKFSQVINLAVKDGPQLITKRGEEVAIVLSMAQYRQLTASQNNLYEFFRESPLLDVDIDLTRDQSFARETLEL